MEVLLHKVCGRPASRTMSLRAAGPEDAAAFYALQNEVRAAMPHPEQFVPDTLENIARYLKEDLCIGVLAYLDPDISVTVIENGKAVKKEKPQPPKRLVNIVRCKNPRCISSIEEECDQIFELSSNGRYRCIYCEQELQVKPE